MSDIKQWYDTNRLVINASKSNAMLVTTRNKIAQLKELDLDVSQRTRLVPSRPTGG